MMEAAILDLERALGFLAFRLSTINQGPDDFAKQQEADMVAGQTSVAYHRRQAEIKRYERIEKWRARQQNRK